MIFFFDKCMVGVKGVFKVFSGFWISVLKKKIQKIIYSSNKHPQKNQKSAQYNLFDLFYYFSSNKIIQNPPPESTLQNKVCWRKFTLINCKRNGINYKTFVVSIKNSMLTRNVYIFIDFHLTLFLSFLPPPLSSPPHIDTHCWFNIFEIYRFGNKEVKRHKKSSRSDLVGINKSEVV